MPNNSAVVDLISGLSRQPGAAEGKAFELGPEGISVTFAGGETARLMPGGAGAIYADVLASLQRDGQPVYVELDAERVIARLLVPLVARVVALHATAAGDVDVELFPSHARHFLRREQDGFAELREALAKPKADGDWLVVTTDDAHQIIDVRPLPGGGRKGPGLPNPLLRGSRQIFSVWWQNWRRWWWARYCILCCWLPLGRCVSMSTCWAMFNLVASKSCNPVTAPAPCIPFLYPDDGCWGRAHEMCRLMLQQGATPAKVWIQGALTAKTKNNPSCAVHWGWHVAPTLCVRDIFCRLQTYVIDPSLFTGPVTEATWKSVQGDPNATLTDTSWTIFLIFGNVTDPNYVQTNQVLNTYRNALKVRSAGANGPPPYAFCP